MSSIPTPSRNEKFMNKFIIVGLISVAVSVFGQVRTPDFRSAARPPSDSDSGNVGDLWINWLDQDIYIRTNGPSVTSNAWGPFMDGGSSTFSQLMIGSGTLATNYYAPIPQLLSIAEGSSSAPDTTQGPVAKVSRIQEMSASGISGDGSDYAAAFQAINIGTVSNEVQTVGVYGVAKTYSTVSSPSGADDGSITISTSGNVLVGVTLTQNKACTLTYDSGAAKWFVPN